MSGTNVDELEELKDQLRTLRNSKIQGMIIRSRVKWLHEGERVSKYFCNLENRNFVEKSMGFLEKENGIVLFEQKEILEEVKWFYEDLYRKREINEINLEEIIDDNNIPK